MASANLENSAQTLHADQNLIAGRYRIHTRIGLGRLGEIFTAIDEGDAEPGDEPHLAIQVIPESIVRKNRLFNTINLGYTVLRAAAHPNIVDFGHFGRDGRSGYLVMDLLDGVSLRVVLDEEKTLPLDEAKPVIRGVGEALRLLHAKDMVHGNITTSNVFITHELEVRLLDVLPLDADTSEAFKRCTIEDDVFGLACLAYEMLAGKHPFNDTSPTEARLAALEADRIASLSDSEWNALRRVLSFDRGQRTSSIADFMRDFGIKGTERLLPTAEQPTRPEPVATPTEVEAQPDPTVDDATVDSDPWNDDWPPSTGLTRERARPLRAVFLGVLLAGLSGWFFYGQPHENTAELISYVSERIDVGLAETTDAVVEIPTPDPARSDLTDAVAMIEEIVVTTAQRTYQPAPVAPLQSEPELDFVESIVSVSERDGAARIAPLLPEDSATQLVWWTSEHTANVDQDFISVEKEALADAPAGESVTLFVPLVNDNLPEAPESFFVNFGLRNTQQGRIERIAIVRVDIMDDDLP